MEQEFKRHEIIWDNDPRYNPARAAMGLELVFKPCLPCSIRLEQPNAPRTLSAQELCSSCLHNREVIARLSSPQFVIGAEVKPPKRLFIVERVALCGSPDRWTKGTTGIPVSRIATINRHTIHPPDYNTESNDADISATFIEVEGLKGGVMTLEDFYSVVNRFNET